MFAIHCPTLDDVVLIWAAWLRGIRNSPRGIEVTFRCACRADAVWLTGSAVREPALITHSTPAATAA
jgi:hypothetical protein